MPTQSDRSVKPRPALSKERVLRAAVDLADTRGIDSLTMRRLAKDLDVEAMSLYHYVANKEELRDGMVDLVIGMVDLPAIETDWKAAMRRRALSTHEVMGRHPWAGVLMDSRSHPGPATLHHHNWVIGVLREGGFSIELAAHAFAAIDAYIYGFGLQEMSLPFDNEEELSEVTDNILQMLPAEKYPHLTAMIIEHSLKPGYDFANEFEFGLDVMLDGLERLQRTD